ncbi:MAG: hypothetical protein MUO35_10840, partial [Anaerolineales bacterium]|nr:hypothetical protein [Anaerolineales bacterium]
VWEEGEARADLPEGDDTATPEPATIGQAFYDADATHNGIVRTELWVGTGPYTFSSSNPNDPAIDYGASGPALAIRLLTLGAKLLAPAANADYVEHADPNVDVSLYYNLQRQGAFAIPGVLIENRSKEPIWIYGLEVTSGDDRDILLPARLDVIADVAYLPPAVLPEQSMRVAFPEAQFTRYGVWPAEIQLRLRAGDITYLPKWRMHPDGRLEQLFP